MGNKATMNFSTISNPEFINLQSLDINPMMSECFIKVLYVGKNRNGSYISKEVATDMAKTLRGAPIVGYYKEDKGDFQDHGEQLIFDDEGVHFNCLTKPYGFVAPDADVWFQTFQETNDFGEQIEREYLMTKGYLWTGQFEETQDVTDSGRPQSMELDEKSLQGHWSEDTQGYSFFIITDAIFSKLCILGQDVEPCFEGASITGTSFTLDEHFTKTLYSMMQELNFALKGGQQMDQEKVQKNLDIFDETDFTENQVEVEKEKVSETVINTDYTLDEFVEEQTDTFDIAEQYQLLQKKNEELQADYDNLNAQFKVVNERMESMLKDFEELTNFKNQVEDAQKDELINSFYMLSDEDKKDVIENKSQYTLEEIEAKLSVICFRNKNFYIEENKTPVTTFTALDTGEDTVPAWVSALRNTQKSKNI